MGSEFERAVLTSAIASANKLEMLCNPQVLEVGREPAIPP